MMGNDANCAHTQKKEKMSLVATETEGKLLLNYLHGSSARHYHQNIQRNRNGQEEKDELNNTVK